MMIIGNSIELSNQIGNGSYGAVFLGKDINSDELYAVKKISKRLLLSSSTIAYLNNEIYILKHLTSHSNIVKFHQIVETISNYYIVFEYCNGGNLEQTITKYQSLYNKPFTEEITRYITKHIVTGLAFLNKNKIIHRDIKVENILLHYTHQEDLLTMNIMKAQVKIIDFGFARYLEQNELASTILGTPLFMDPKMLSAASNRKKNELDNNNNIYNDNNNYNGHPCMKNNIHFNNDKVIQNGNANNNNNLNSKSDHLYNSKADIWSLGIIVYRMLMGLLPFSGKNWTDLFSSIKERMFVLPSNKHKLILSKGAIKFIDKLLNIDMNKRPTAKELMEDSWLNDSLSNEDKQQMVIKSDNELSLQKEASLLLFENYWEVKKDITINKEQYRLMSNQKNQNKKESKNRFLLIDGLLERLGKNGKQCNGNTNKMKNIVLTDTLDNKEVNIVKHKMFLSPCKNNNNKDNEDKQSDPGTPIKEDNHIFSFCKTMKCHK